MKLDSLATLMAPEDPWNTGYVIVLHVNRVLWEVANDASLPEFEGYE